MNVASMIVSNMENVTMNTRRPSTDTELQTILRKAYSYAQKGLYNKAMELCDWLIEDKSTQIAGLRQRATVKEHMDDINGAILDLENLLSSSKDEPCDYHQLGVLLLLQGNTEEAITNFSKVIELEQDEEVHYYTNSALIHKAEAELRCRNWEMAKLDCQRLPGGYKAYFYGKGMRTREEIEEDADKGLSRR